VVFCPPPASNTLNKFDEYITGNNSAANNNYNEKKKNNKSLNKMYNILFDIYYYILSYIEIVESTLNINTLTIAILYNISFLNRNVATFSYS